jgi:hypothetical protein
VTNCPSALPLWDLIDPKSQKAKWPYFQNGSK